MQAYFGHALFFLELSLQVNDICLPCEKQSNVTCILNKLLRLQYFLAQIPSLRLWRKRTVKTLYLSAPNAL